jgi:hypothetical protein
MNRTHDIQGRFLGIPYDWRWPTLGKVLRRVYTPGGPMLAPKAFGWGWTLNFAHPGSWLVLGLALAVALIAAVAG